MADPALAAGTSYHDYVIKDGRFIGDFEAMYKNCADPWHQDAIQPVSEDVALALLARRSYAHILDVGCGKGRFSDRLHRSTGGSVRALDISETAVQTARSRYPGIRFAVEHIPPIPFGNNQFDLIVAAELLWYILPKLSEFFTEVRRVLKPGGHFLVLQTFYQPGQQRYGREILDGAESLIEKLPLQLLHRVEVDRLPNHKLVALCEKTA